MKYLSDHMLLRIAQGFALSTGIFCIIQALRVFVFASYPVEPIQGRLSKLILSQSLTDKLSKPKEMPYDLEKLYRSTCLQLPETQEERINKANQQRTQSPKSYLQHLEEARQKRADQHTSLDQYDIDGIIWSHTNTPLVILKNKQTGRRLYLKQSAHLKDWLIHNIQKTSVQFRLLDDPSVIKTRHLQNIKTSNR